MKAGGAPLVHTYSIVARDAATGEMGVAVQSHWFAVGAIVSWAEAGVGAIATQAFVDPGYGVKGLERLRQGRPAAEALRELLQADGGRDVRQVAIVDAHGGVAAHTGEGTVPAAGQHVGNGYSVQANMMESERVWPAMARAFEATAGDLADRLLAALDAAEAAGGDLRGRQSASLVVVRGERSAQPWTGRLFDIRVDDHPQPLAELRRLATLQRAYNHMNAGDSAVEARDFARALREYSAASALVPDHLEMMFWHGVALANMGRPAEARPLLERCYGRAPQWRELARRLAAMGLLAAD